MVGGQPVDTGKLIEIDHLQAADGDPSSLITALLPIGHRRTSTVTGPAGSYVGSWPWKSRLAGFIPSQHVFRPSLTADELEMYFTIGVVGPSGHFVLNVAKRNRSGDSFGPPESLLFSTPTADQLAASVSGDGLILFFQSPDGNDARMYVSTRASRSDVFGSSAYVANANSTNSNEGDRSPFVNSDESELWFSSTRLGGQGGDDIYRATGHGSQFGAAANIAALNSGNNETDPVLSFDKLTIYFQSDRPGGVGNSGDIWVAHRNSASDVFTNIAPVAELNSRSYESPGWLSPDNCRLYFVSEVSTTPNNVYIATRHPH